MRPNITSGGKVHHKHEVETAIAIAHQIHERCCRRVDLRPEFNRESGVRFVEAIDEDAIAIERDRCVGVRWNQRCLPELKRAVFAGAIVPVSGRVDCVARAAITQTPVGDGIVERDLGGVTVRYATTLKIVPIKSDRSGMICDFLRLEGARPERELIDRSGEWFSATIGISDVGRCTATADDQRSGR